MYFSISIVVFFLKYNLLALFALSNPNNIHEIHEHVKQISSWKCFLLARWCIRHCLYRLAIDLLQILMNCVHTSTTRVWLETLIDICRAEERLQTVMNSSEPDLQVLCENLAEAGSFYESSLIRMPVRRLLILVRRIFNSYFSRQAYQLTIVNNQMMRHSISSEHIVTYVHQLFISFMN